MSGATVQLHFQVITCRRKSDTALSRRVLLQTETAIVARDHASSLFPNGVHRKIGRVDAST